MEISLPVLEVSQSSGLHQNVTFVFIESQFLKELRCTCLTAGESNSVVLQHLCIFVERGRVIYGNHLAPVLVFCWYKLEPSILN